MGWGKLGGFDGYNYVHTKPKQLYNILPFTKYSTNVRLYVQAPADTPVHHHPSAGSNKILVHR